ncbi:hypothetical protein Pth03_09650 [Planotetraspora thailandica]|uniref:Kinase n=1 Tax=Planotetraspora thailandica TaxID=487172 RepID=A0A8J3V030_9ACTN|nr:AAA family ATPase [Planotetraspora thailandica]GII52576.1 hypothetical protein Pth03_09650 [Planotetraspora thailandica]
MSEGSSPALIVVSGSPGSGKTTLAHRVARTLGCPAICRDEIKQGMVHTARDGGELDKRTLTAFFDVVGVLLRAGVTVVAEAAFQDRLWRPNLEPLADLARIRVVRCVAAAATAHERIDRRFRESPLRAAHSDHALLQAIAEGDYTVDSFVPISMDVPTLTVDTTHGYDPKFQEIVAFAS